MFSIRAFVLRGVLESGVLPINPVLSFFLIETDTISSSDIPSPVEKTINGTVVMTSPKDRVAVWQGVQITPFGGSTIAEAPTGLPLA